MYTSFSIRKVEELQFQMEEEAVKKMDQLKVSEINVSTDLHA